MRSLQTIVRREQLLLQSPDQGLQCRNGLPSERLGYLSARRKPETEIRVRLRTLVDPFHYLCRGKGSRREAPDDLRRRTVHETCCFVRKAPPRSRSTQDRPGESDSQPPDLRSQIDSAPSP